MLDPSMDSADYARLRATADRDVASWSRGSGPTGSPLPLAAERGGEAPGRLTAEGLADRPAALADGEVALGLRADGQTAVMLRGTSFSDRAYETFVTEEPGGVRLDAFDYGTPRERLSETRIAIDGGRPARAVIRTAEGEDAETYRYDGDRLARVEVVTAEPDGTRTTATLVVDYTPTREVASVRTVYDDGYEATTYTRSVQPDLTDLLAAVEDGLVAAVQPSAERALAATTADAFALALAYSFEGPPLPPLLGVLTAAEHDALAAASNDPWDAWNPAEYRLFDVPETEIDLSPALDAACDAVNDAVSSEADERAVVAMLNQVAARLNALPWGVAVFATDLEGADAAANLAAAVSPERLASLRDAGRPTPSG